MPAPTIENWDRLTEFATSRWSEVALIRVWERERSGEADRKHPIVTLKPRAEDEPCPVLLARFRSDFTLDPDEDPTEEFESLAPDTLMELTLTSLRHEVEQWAEGVETRQPLLVGLYDSKSVALGTRTIHVQDTSPAPEPEAPALARQPALMGLGLPGGHPSEPFLGAGGLTELDQVEDPVVRQLMLANILMAQHVDRVAAAYQKLNGELGDGYARLHQVTTATLEQVERESRTRYRHVERVYATELSQAEVALRRRRAELDRVGREAAPEGTGNTTVSPEVQEKAIDAFAGVGNKLLGAFMAAKGFDPALTPLLDLIEENPQLRDQLPKLAEAAKDPAIRDGLLEAIKELSEVDLTA